MRCKYDAGLRQKSPASFPIMRAAVYKLGSVKRGSGGVVCLYDNLIPLGGDDMVIPLQYV